MEDQKYKPGDRVKCVNYGHAIYELSPAMKIIDLMPELLGENGTIESSYTELYGLNENSNSNNLYAVKWDTHGRISWFVLEQLEFVQ